MVNEANFSVTGYVATQPKLSYTRSGEKTVYMRVGWTPRRRDRKTGEWTDQQTSFISVICFRKVAENAALCLRRGDPVILKGTLQVREHSEGSAPRRQVVEVIAESIGHDLTRGYTVFNRSVEQTEMTAIEREQSLAAEGRQPLPGDSLAAAERAGAGGDAGDETPDDIEDLTGGSLTEPDLADRLGPLDDAEAAALLGSAEEPVAAGAV